MKAKTPIRKKFDRALTLLLALTVIGGSIHWVAGDTEQLPEGVEVYDLPVMQSDPDFDPEVDILENISYPEDRYTNLRVEDWGGFNIDELGEYELTYALDRIPAEEPPAQPEEPPAQPEQPSEPEQPAEPEQPTQPEQPDNSGETAENPGETEAPDNSTENGGTENGGTDNGSTENGGSDNGSTDNANTEGSTEDNAPAGDAAALALEDEPALIAEPVGENGEEPPVVISEEGVNEISDAPAEEGVNEASDAPAEDLDAGFVEETPASAETETVYFKRTVIVMDPEAMEQPMPILVEDEINNGFPWGSGMTGASVTLHVPRESYSGTGGAWSKIILQRTKDVTLTSPEILTTEWVTVKGVSGSSVFLSGSELVDGAWYRFLYGDRTCSNPVRLVYASSDGQVWGVFSDKKDPVRVGGAGSSALDKWYISSNSIMYRVGPSNRGSSSDYDFNIFGRIHLGFMKPYEWVGTSYRGFWTMAGSEADQNRLKPVSSTNDRVVSPMLKAFRLSFSRVHDYSVTFEIVPDTEQTKHISIATDTYFGNQASVAEPDKAPLAKIMDRKQAKIQLVGVRNLTEAKNNSTNAFAIKFDQECLPDRSAIGVLGTADQLWADSDAEQAVGVDSAMSMSWLDLDKKADPTIRFSFTIGSYSDLGSVEDTVEFKSGEGSFVQEDGKAPKTSFRFYDGENLGSTTVLPTTGSPLVLEKFPQCTPGESAAQLDKVFVGWKLKVSGQADAAIDTNKVYFDEDIRKLTYRSIYGTMTFTAHYAETEAEVYKGDALQGKYGNAALALAAAKNGETVKLLKDSALTPAEGAELKNGVSIRQTNGNTVTATANGTYINVAADGAITLCTGENQKDGAISVSHTTADRGNRTVTVDGYTLSTTFDYTVKAVDANSRAHDSKASVTLPLANQIVTVTKDGQGYCTFTSAEHEKTFYIGGYRVALDWRNRTAAGTLPEADAETGAATAQLKASAKLPYYKQKGHTMTIVPVGNYKFTDNTASKVFVSMMGENGEHRMLTQNTDFTVTKDSDSQLTVKINDAVAITGELLCYMGPVDGNDLMTHEMTTLTVTLKADTAVTDSKPGTVTVHALGKEYKMIQQAGTDTYTGKVPLGEPLSVTFAPTDFSAPYYQAFTKEEGSTFSLLTKLVADDTVTYDLSKPTQRTQGADAADASAQDDVPAAPTAPGATFDWVPKAYTVEYTAANKTADGGTNKLEATFTKSHVFRVFLTGGTVKVTKTDDTTTGLIHKDHDEVGDDSHYIIVKHGTQLKVVMERGAGVQAGHFNAFWAEVSANQTQSKGENLPKENGAKLEGENTEKITYTTIPVTKPFILNANFEKDQPITVKVTGGDAVSAAALPKDFDQEVWKDEMDKEGYPQINGESGNKVNDDAMKNRIKPTWTTADNETFTTTLEYGQRIFAVVEAEKDFKPIRASVDNLTFEGKALEDLLKTQTFVEYENGGKTYYIYRSNPIYRAWNAELVFAKDVNVTFTQDGTTTLTDNEGNITGATSNQKIPGNLFDRATQAVSNGTQKFFAWVEKRADTAVGTVKQVYTKLTEVLSDLVLKPLFRDNNTQVAIGENGHIAATGLTVSPDVFARIKDDKAAILKEANAEIFDAAGKPVESTNAAIKTEWSDALTGVTPASGLYNDGLIISMGDLSVKVNVRITEKVSENPVITGKTAHALSFQGKANTKHDRRFVFLRCKAKHIVQAIHYEALASIGRAENKIQAWLEINNRGVMSTTGHH